MRDLIGIVKDKVSLSKLAIISKPNTLSLHVAVLRITSHTPSTPPNDHHITTFLSLGDSSRATASVLIYSLMNRLHSTNDSHVSLKCLFTIHHIIKRGPFILKDQLSVFHYTSGHDHGRIHISDYGRNNFKLSGFRDGSSATSWVLSAWVQWYARYLETILSTSKNLGFVICSSTRSLLEKEKQEDSISSFMNSDLIRDFSLLICVVEEICKVPDNLLVERNKLLQRVMELLANDYMTTVNEILLRLGEFKKRVNLLSFNNSVELASALDRLTSCKEKSFQLFSISKPSIETLWEMIEELNNRIGMVNYQKLGRKDSGSESARFGDRVIRPSDSIKFMSGRLRLNWSG